MKRCPFYWHYFTCYRLPTQTREHHIYDENQPLTSARAIQFSTKRSGSVAYNTVFAKPQKMYDCDTNEGKLMISSQPVQAYQCTWSNQQWSAEDRGKSYAIFSLNGSHFPGSQYLNKKVKFLQKEFWINLVKIIKHYLLWLFFLIWWHQMAFMIYMIVQRFKYILSHFINLGIV